MDFQPGEKDRLLQRTARELAQREFAADGPISMSGPGTRGCGPVVVETGTPGLTKGKTGCYMSGETHCAFYFGSFPGALRRRRI